MRESFLKFLQKLLKLQLLKMTERVKENLRLLLTPRKTPIQDEVLNQCLAQARRQVLLPILPEVHLEKVIKNWVESGYSVGVAAAIIDFEIEEGLAKQMLAQALENNALYFQKQPRYLEMKEVLDHQIKWMENAAKRLRGREI